MLSPATPLFKTQLPDEKQRFKSSINSQTSRSDSVSSALSATELHDDTQTVKSNLNNNKKKGKYLDKSNGSKAEKRRGKSNGKTSTMSSSNDTDSMFNSQSNVDKKDFIKRNIEVLCTTQSLFAVMKK
jgi:hypothetical protein